MTEPTQPTEQPRELGIEGVEIEPDENGRRRIRMPDGGICYPDETLSVGTEETEKASEQTLPREQGTTVTVTDAVTDTPKEI